MSFSSPMGGSTEVLAYMIKAFDDATPVFKAFGSQVDAITKSVQAAVVEMNKAMAVSGKGVTDMAMQEEAALTKVSESAKKAAAAATQSSQAQVDAAKRASAAVDQQAVAATRAAETQRRAAVESAAAFGAASSGITKVGRDIVIASVAAGAAFLDLQGKFQANTLRMQTQAGATAQGLDQIRKGLLAMAGQVGATPDQLANGMYHVVSAMNAVLPPTTRVSQELKIMKIAAEGAQVGHSNLEETTYALSSALNALHDNAKQAGMVMGQLNAIVGSGDMTMSDLLDAFKSGLIPAARSFGLSLQSVGAALSVMGDMGMRGALAGTRLRMAISLLGAPTDQAAKILMTLGLSSKQAISTSEAMSQALAKAGINITQLSADLRKPDGLQVALQDLNNHLMASGLNADAAGATISRAFGGGRMGAAIMLLAENTDRLQAKFKQIGETGQNFGRDWQLTSQTFRVELDKALASLEAFGIKIGEYLLPYAGKALKDIEDLTNWFAKNKTALDILGATVITFASVAVGSYFVSKITKAIDLTKQFGSGVAGMGRWMLGIGSTPSTATGPLATGGPAATAVGGAASPSTLSNVIVGWTGNPRFPGMKSNPIAVTIIGAGMATGAASATEAQAQQAAGVGPAAGKVKDPLTGKMMTPAEIAAGAEADATAAAAAAAATTRIHAPAGGFMGYKGGQIMSRSAAEIMSIPAGASAARELSASEAALMPQIEKQITQEMDLFAQSTLKVVETEAAKFEQLGLMGLTNLPMGGSAFKGLTAEEKLLGAGGGMGPLAGLGYGLQAIPGMAKDAAGFLKTAGSTALRGGVLGGTIFLGSQLAGQLIPGQAGQTVSHVGTFAGAGAAAGTLATLIPGVGPLVGPLVGALSGAIVGGLTEAFKKPDFGKKVADSLPAGFGGAQRGSLQATVAQDLNALQKLTASTTTELIQQRGAPRVPGAQGHQVAITVPVHLDFSQLNVDQQAQYLRLAHDAGIKLATQMDKGFGQYKFQSESVMLDQFKGVFGKMPPAVQEVGVQSMIKFAQGLESQGRLAKGSAQQLLSQIEVLFPKFTDYLGLQGTMSVQQFTKALDLRQSQDSVHKTLTSVENDFADVEHIVTNTSGTITDKAGAAITALRTIADNGTGPMRKQAVADIQALHDQVSASFTDMGSLVDTKMKDMASSIIGGSASSAATATTDFGNFSNAIQKAMTAGDLVVSQGMQIIAKTTDQVIKALGGTPIPIPALIHAQQLTQAFSQGKTGVSGVLTGAATGGKIMSPSYIAGEEAPLHPEYVLSTNPAYLPRNTKLWASWAKEVGIPGFAQGGYIDPIPGYHLGRTDMGVDASGSPGAPILAFGPSVMTALIPNWYRGQPLMDFQLTGGPDIGRYWYVAEQITPLAHVGERIPQGGVVARFASSGTGIEIGWAANASGQTLAQATTGYHEGQITPAGQAFMSIIGGPTGTALSLGTGIGTITAPQVSGKGAFTQIAQAALNLVAGVANAHVGNAAGAMGLLPPATSGSALANQAIAKAMMAQFGWGMNQWPFLDQLWNKESGWSATARNSSSGAAGIPQDITGNFHGGARGQILWGENYIKGRYGTPQAAWAHEQQFNWYKRGGRIPYAGAFGHGGAFTATSPTMAMFGDRGPESVFAVPHYQMGGTFASDIIPLGSPQWSPAPASQVPTPPSTSPSTKAPTKRYHYDPLTGTIIYVTAQEWNQISAEIAYARAHAPEKVKVETPKPWYDPSIGKIIEVTPSEKTQLIAQNAQSRAQQTAANKKHAAEVKAHNEWLAGTVSDVLEAGKMPVGAFDITRRQAIAGHLPVGGSLQLINKDLNDLSQAAWTKVVSALNKGVADMPESQIMRVAKTLSTHAGPQGSRQAQLAAIAISAGLKDVTSDFGAQQTRFQDSRNVASLLAGLASGTPLSALRLTSAELRSMGLNQTSAAQLIGGGPAAYTNQITQLQNQAIPQYQADADRLQKLYQDALKTHNKKLQDALQKQLDAVSQAQVQAYADLQQAQVNEVDAIYNKAQSKINQAQGGVDLIAAFQGLTSGTTTSGIGLSSGALAALGLAGINLNAFAGGANPLAAANATNQLLGSERSSMVDTLNQLVASLPTLSGSALDQANQHILDLSKSVASVSQEMNQDLMNAIKATAQAFQDQADTAAGHVSVLGSIANLPVGTNLSAIGITPQVLAAAGISPSVAAAVMGGGPNAIAADRNAQSGQLTPAQIAAAQAYYTTANAGISSEIGVAGHQRMVWIPGPNSEHPGHWQLQGGAGTGLAGELSYDEAVLPTLGGADYTSMVTTINNLITEIAGLGSTMSDNTTAMNQLTTATNANTSATGQMTGTVGYTYGGQSGYTASLSSASTLDLGVGS